MTDYLYLRKYYLQNNYVNVQTMSDPYIRPLHTGAEIEMTLAAPYTDGVKALLAPLISGGALNIAAFGIKDTPRREWRCLYCTSVWSLEVAKCKNCGAVRNWLL